jgi:hypothetical protein
MSNEIPIRHQFRPSIKGLVDSRVEAVIRSLEERVDALKASAEMVKAAKFLPSTVATQQYSPSSIRKAISAGGQAPLDVSNLPGVLLQPQRSGVSGVDALPGWNNIMSQEGALLALRPTLAMYRFDGSVSPGVWRALAATGVLQFGTRAAMSAAGNAGYMYYQTDTGWLYYDNGTNYVYLCGIDKGTNAVRLALGIGANDNSAVFYVTDRGVWWRVSAGAWTQMYVSLTIGISGTLPVTHGGSGLAALTDHAILVGSGVADITPVGPGLSNTVLHGITGADPAFSAVDLTADVTGILPAANWRVASVNLTAQNASIGDTLLYAVPAAAAGIYRVSYYLITTTAGNAVTCLATIKWTDTEQAQVVASATIDISTDADFEYGSMVLYSVASQNINYATTVSGPIGAGVYSLYLRVEAL